jgi:CheY-like chemotaxis protein
MAHMLLDSPLPAGQRECVEILRSSGESLLALINDILDVSKVEAGKLELEEIELDVRAVVDDALSAVAMSALGKDLDVAAHVAADIPFRLRGDPGRLRQCLVNLLGNAVKFTSQGEVTIEADLVSLEDQSAVLRFTVADTGIGIAADRLDRLFQQFSQVDSSTTRHFGGSGLGLSIVKRLAALMGGDVGVSSHPGEGSRFWFTARLEVGALATVPAPGVRVLVLESNPTAGRFLARQLESLGHAAESCATAQQLEKTLTPTGAPVVVLIDGRLMDGDPLAVAARCRGLPQSPFIVLLNRLGDAAARPPVGIDAVLTKPVRSLQLSACIERLRAAPPGPREESAPQAAEHPAWRVLLVEDNAVNRRVAEHQLTRLGCVVGIATNGVEAITAVAERTWDLVLMDCQMPVMDGFDATREIRRLEASGRRVPIIALTANALAGDRDACLAAGMDDFLSKPIAPAALAGCVERWATQRGPTAAALPLATSADLGFDLCTPRPPVDLVALNELTDGDTEFQRELIDVFIASGDTTLAALREAMQSEDLPSVRRYAHSLKGASANLRAAALAARALVLEQAAAAGDVAECQRTSAALENDYRQASEFIGARRAELA